jgi:hypothetical protein
LLRLSGKSVAELIFGRTVKFQIDHDYVRPVLLDQGKYLIAAACLEGRDPATRKCCAEHFSSIL